jgi:ribose 5-phosphate isomerase RpiB
VTWRHCREDDQPLAQVVLGGPATIRRLIILSSRWADVVCRANRNPQLRAAAVHSVQAVRQACQQLDVNVLVIDAAALTDGQLHAIIRQYVAGAPDVDADQVPTLLDRNRT